MAVRAGGLCRSANNKGGALPSPLACEIIGMMMGVAATALTAAVLLCDGDDNESKEPDEIWVLSAGRGGAELSRVGPPLTSSPTLPTEAAEGRET